MEDALFLSFLELPEKEFILERIKRWVEGGERLEKPLEFWVMLSELGLARGWGCQELSGCHLFIYLFIYLVSSKKTKAQKRWN